MATSYAPGFDFQLERDRLAMFKRGIYWLTAIVLMLGLFAYPGVAGAESVAMITDIAGVITEQAASRKEISISSRRSRAQPLATAADAARPS
jgi:hypothetical protein